MASLHAGALIAIGAGLLGSADAPADKRADMGPPDPISRPGVTVSNGAVPGAVIIANTSPAVQWVARALAVERRDGEGWRPVSTTLDLIAACDPRFPRRVAPVRLGPGQSVSVQPWTGFACGGQCSATCKLNFYHSGGPFRVVATVLPGNRRIAGPPFVMPDRPEPPVDVAISRQDILDAIARPRPGKNDP